MGQKQSAATDGRRSAAKDSLPSRTGDKPTNDGLASPFRRGLVAINDTSSPIHKTYSGLESRAIGSGGTSEVRIVTHRVTKRRYACKSIKLLRVPPKMKKQLMAEIEIIRSLDHPNCIKVIEVFKQLDYLHIIMELCEGGELFDRLADSPGSKMKEVDAQYLVVKMLRALNYLHEHGIIHRDLKLENFIFTSKKKDADIKLIDFGYSRTYLEGEKMTSLVGTSFYIAPEVVEGDYTKAADLWSFGCVVYMLVTGELPIPGDTDSEIMHNVVRLVHNPRKFGVIATKVPGVKLSNECVDFINRLMDVDVNQRLTATQALEHPWITNQTLSGAQISKAESFSGTEEAREVAKKVTTFKTYPDIKRAALVATAFYMDTSKIEELQDVFQSIDKDGNGVITYKEFSSALKNQLNDKELHEIFEAMDQDHTNKIKYSEFVAACVEERSFKEEEDLMLAFRKMDIDGDGVITKSELRTQLGDSFTDAAIDKIVQEADFGHDGSINKQEFLRAMRGEQVTN